MLYCRSLRFASTGVSCLHGLVILLLLTGCQSQSEQTTPASPESTKPAAPATETPLTIRVVSRESLDLDQVLSDPFTVEPGQLAIASPVNWGLAPRSSRYVARFYFYKNRRTRLPRIWITSTPVDGSGIETVTHDNVIKYATTLATQFEKESKAGLLESVKPMVIADRACARYVLKTRFIFKDGNNERAVVAERQVLQTIIQGRQFIVELHVLPGELRKFRDISYAVLAAIDMLQESEPLTEPLTEPLPDDPAAAEPGKPAGEAS